MIIMDFEKITKEAVVQALLEIKKNGIPKNAHSSTYDILYKGKSWRKWITLLKWERNF